MESEVGPLVYSRSIDLLNVSIVSGVGNLLFTCIVSSACVLSDHNDGVI